MKSYTRKDLNCKICDETVNNVGIEATAVTCWKCVNDQLRGMPMNMCEEDLEKHTDSKEYNEEE